MYARTHTHTRDARLKQRGTERHIHSTLSGSVIYHMILFFGSYFFALMLAIVCVCVCLCELVCSTMSRAVI